MPVDLFYSYSHKDEPLRDELDTHLALLRRRQVLNVWHDRKIAPGDAWAQSIDKHLESADVILLLVTPDFIASDYCFDVEMGRAIERHRHGEAAVVPVIARSVDLEGAPFADIQALPRDAKPVTSWSNRDEAWTDVAKGIRKLAETIASRKPSPPAPSPAAAEPSTSAASTSRRPDGPADAIATTRTVRQADAPAAAQRADVALERAVAGFQQEMTEAARRRVPDAIVPPAESWSIGERLAAVPGWKRILWVDDQPANNALEIAAFNRLQIEVETRTSTDAGLDALATAPEPFDLVVSDWQRESVVPGVPEGLRFLRAIRERGIETPTIFYHGPLAAPLLWTRRKLVQAAGGQGATFRPDELFTLATALLAPHGKQQ